MTKHRNIWEYVRANSLDYYQTTIQPEGLNYFLKAATAKILWVTLLYLLATYLLPLENRLYRSIAIIALGGLALEIWEKIIKDHTPKWCDDLISGKIFFEIDVPALNKYIAYLFLADLSLFAGPSIWGYIKEKLYEKK